MKTSGNEIFIVNQRCIINSTIPILSVFFRLRLSYAVDVVLVVAPGRVISFILSVAHGARNRNAMT